jgi:hypothetical protein
MSLVFPHYSGTMIQSSSFQINDDNNRIFFLCPTSNRALFVFGLMIEWQELLFGYHKDKPIVSGLAGPA